MHDLALRFQSQLIDSGLLPAGSRVLVAVSGGADSLALLLLLHGVADVMSLELQAAHLDHGLRPESAADARFVASVCRGLDMPLSSERREVAALAARQKANLEETARQVRRGYLQEVAQQKGCAAIALGHHRDDQAETFLLHLLRGAGTTGLAGMRPRSGPFVRPLLNFSRDELRSYLRAQGQTWREDATNAETRLTRNKLRHELLPLLREFNPRVEARLSRLCVLFAADEDFWAAETSRLLEVFAEPAGDGLALPRSLLADLPPAAAGRLVRAALEQVRGTLRRIEGGHVESILALAANPAPQPELHLPGAWVAGRYEGLLILPDAPRPVEPSPVILTGPGRYPLPDGRLLEVELCAEPQGESRDAVEFSAAEVDFPLRIRTVRPGDRLAPAGMQGTKKLQDLFTDAKLSREQRARQPLLVRDGEILWVVGMRRCRGYRPRPAGERVMNLRVSVPNER